MRIKIFGKIGKVVKNVVTHKPKKRNVSSTIVPRKNYFIGNLASVAVILKNRFIVGRRVTYKNIVKQTDKARERLLCAQIALKAIPFNLPDNFIGDLGASVPVLIKKAIGEKAASNPKPQTTYTCNVFTLTG